NPSWTKVADSVAWQPRDSQGQLVYKNSMWIFGGWFKSDEAPPRDVWKSTDGIHWELVTALAPWKHSDFPMVANFRNKMWIMGGWYTVDYQAMRLETRCGHLPTEKNGNSKQKPLGLLEWRALSSSLKDVFGYLEAPKIIISATKKA